MLYLRKEYFSLLGGTYNGSCILQGYVDEKRLKTPGVEGATPPPPKKRYIYTYIHVYDAQLCAGAPEHGRCPLDNVFSSTPQCSLYSKDTTAIRIASCKVMGRVVL